MKKMKKIFALLIAMVMVLGMSTSVFAASTQNSKKGGNASITITLPTSPDETDPEFTYTVYKVFDATSDGSSSAIAYQIDNTNGPLSDAMTAAGFSVDDAGNVSGPDSLNDAALAAIKAYAKDSVGTFSAKTSDGTLVITGLEYGYYYITTTTGTAVTVDSTNPNATVEDKNSIPSIDKTVAGSSMDEAGKKAIAEVGTEVTYTVKVKVGKGQTNYEMKDTLGTGLEYVAGSLTVADMTAGTDYTLTVSGQDISVKFKDDSIKDLAEGTEIVVTYKATVTSAALQTDPAKNTATISYGKDHTYTSTPSEAEVYNAKFSVIKEDGDKKALAGAGFVVANAEGKYYQLSEDGKDIAWVDSIDDATEIVSDAEGKVESFTGLADGTYTLIEKTVPAGYNKAADSTFTIAASDFKESNLVQSATVTNQSGTELPSTGGIGTTIFYIIGAILVIGAGVVLVARRRMRVQ